jgi:hypothetical protein
VEVIDGVPDLGTGPESEIITQFTGSLLRMIGKLLFMTRVDQRLGGYGDNATLFPKTIKSYIFFQK